MLKLFVLSIILCLTCNPQRAYCGVDESKLTYIDLDKGIYGIPFGATLQEVSKWCEDNAVQVCNLTKQQVGQQAKEYLSRVKEMKESYNTDKLQLSAMEQLVFKMPHGQGINDSEKFALEKVQELLQDLVNPTFDYKKNSYLLEREFKEGIELAVGGINKICKDVRITDMIYMLEVTPTDASGKLKDNCINSLRIFFKKDTPVNFVSYATVATFKNEDRATLEKQFSSVMQVLKEKYGSPVYREKLWYTRSDVQRMKTSMRDFRSTEEEGTPESMIYHLTGEALVSDGLLWRKNISLIATFGNDDLNSLHSDEFFVVYYEPNIAKQILSAYEQAIKDFKEQFAQEDIKKKDSMRDNF